MDIDGVGANFINGVDCIASNRFLSGLASLTPELFYQNLQELYIFFGGLAIARYYVKILQIANNESMYQRAAILSRNFSIVLSPIPWTSAISSTISNLPLMSR